MKTKDLCTITTAALATAALTVAIFHTGSMEAGSDASSPPPKIEQPKLVSHGVEFTLVPQGGRSFKAGDQPVFELRAVNTTQQDISEPVWLSLTGLSMTEMLSRISRPEPVMWHEKQTFTLKAHETKSITVSAGTNLPANKLFNVFLRDFDPSMSLMSVAKSSIVQPPVSAETPRSAIVALSFSTLTNVPFAPVAAPAKLTVTKL